MAASVRRIWIYTLGVVLALISGLALAQQRVGELDYAQGIATAQLKGADARFLSRGDALFEGDLVTTSEKGYAVLAFADGTKITLRPNTSFAIEKFAHDKGAENAFLRLLKGGMRAITGLVGKRNPGGVRVSTITATIGIRGTSFDARLCENDCRQEQNENRPRPGQGAPLPAVDTAVGRIVRISGEVSALQPGQVTRRLVDGSPVLVGDEIITGSKATAVIGFRDQSRVSLEPLSVFRIDSFRYGRPGQSDNFALRLLKGGLRVFTGLIGKKDPSLVTVATVVATIGIRGTGMDISCEGPCAAVARPVSESCKPTRAKGKRSIPVCDDGMFVHTWDGKIFISSGDKELDVGLGQAGFVGKDQQSRLLSSVPDFMKRFVSPRPDGVDIDWISLFGASPYSGEDGLYVLNRDGHVFLEASGGHLDLGPGEGGVVGADGKPRRLDPIPSFLADDPFPAPENFDINDPLILQLFGTTLGNPGQDMCLIQ